MRGHDAVAATVPKSEKPLAARAHPWLDRQPYSSLFRWYTIHAALIYYTEFTRTVVYLTIYPLMTRDRTSDFRGLAAVRLGW